MTTLRGLEKLNEIRDGALANREFRMSPHTAVLDPKKFHQYRYDSKAIAKRRTEAGAHEVRVPGVSETRFWAYA